MRQADGFRVTLFAFLLAQSLLIQVNQQHVLHYPTFYFFAIWSRSLSSCARSSGVNSAPKSSVSKTCRISISASPSMGFGQRLTHSMASSFELTFQIQKPAISSLVSG